MDSIVSGHTPEHRATNSPLPFCRSRGLAYDGGFSIRGGWLKGLSYYSQADEEQEHPLDVDARQTPSIFNFDVG